ncbi:MAG: alpha-amylase family glycosyl hydrolase [Rhodoluna sp.]|nr:alpha-amylase family glycosyl hydrolase [Rhodoluna sp.]
MSLVKRLRISKIFVLAFALLIPAIGMVPQASADESYQIVVHVPGVVGVVPNGAKITLTDAANPSSKSQSRLIGQDSYGWFGVVDVPAGADSVRVNATKSKVSNVAIDPYETEEIWLNTKGVPFLYESSASLTYKINLVAKGAALSNRSVKVMIGSSTKTYKFIGTGTKRYVLIPVTAKTKSIVFTLFNKKKAGETYFENPRKYAKVWVGDGFEGARTSESWANDKLTIHYHRADGKYSGWGIHAWKDADGGAKQPTTWAKPIMPVSPNVGAWGVKFEIPLAANSLSVPLILHNGDVRDPSDLDQSIDLGGSRGEVWFESGSMNSDESLRFALPVPLDGASPATPKDPVLPEAPTLSEAQALASPSLRSAMAKDNIYFLMTDRYQNGDTSNDEMGLTGPREITGFDPTSAVHYHGGDLAGLTDGCTSGKGVKRIKDMGFTAIWITPPFKQRYVQGSSAAYHGYWITDFTDIDPHLGTKKDFKDLIDCAHSQDMKVVLDIVVNHTGDIIYYENGDYNFGDYRKPKVSPGEVNTKKPDFLNNVENYHNRGDIRNFQNKEQYENGDIYGLDDLATEKPEVIEGLAQIYAGWVNDYGVDGFRIDTAKHLDEAFFANWWPRVQELTKDKKPGLFAFGEYYESSTATLTEFVRDRGLPSLLDFAFQDAAVQFSVGNSISNLKNVFDADDWYITDKTNAYNQATFFANHDMGHFGLMLKSAGSTPADLLVDALLGYDLMYMSRGIPSVYYGDELGLIGAGRDKDARQDLFPTEVSSWQTEARIGANPVGTKGYLDEQNHPLQIRIKDLNALRKNHPALNGGAQIQRYAAGTVMAFSRIDAESRTEYLVALNNSGSAKNGVKIKTSSPNTVFSQVWGPAQTVTSDAQGFVTVSLGRVSSIVLKAQSVLPVKGTVGPVNLFVSKDQGLASWKVRASIPSWDDPSTCTFVIKVNNGAWQVLGVDDSIDWKMILSGAKYPAGSKLTVAAIVKSTSGGIGVSNPIQLTNQP